MLISLLAVLALSHPAEAVAGGPSGQAGPSAAAPRARLRWRQDPRSRRFRSALLDAYNGEVDFAGRYVLAEIGCGAGCIRVAALDTRHGEVRWFPYTVSGWSGAFPDPLAYRKDSRLLVVHGRLDEQGNAGAHAFLFDGRRFVAQ